MVMVEDNGVGLPADRERLTEPYVTTRDKGTGLGLAIVNKIVDEHGGDNELCQYVRRGNLRNPAFCPQSAAGRGQFSLMQTPPT